MFSGFGPITIVDKEPGFLKVPGIKTPGVEDKQRAEESAAYKVVDASNGKYQNYGALFSMDNDKTEMRSMHYSAAFSKADQQKGGKATVHFACTSVDANVKVEVRVRLSKTEPKYQGGEIVCGKGSMAEGTFDIELAPSKEVRATVVSPPHIGHWVMGIEMKK